MSESDSEGVLLLKRDMEGSSDDETDALLTTLGPVPAVDSRPPALTSARSMRSRWVEGLLLLLAVNVIWVGASELVQYIYDDLKFDKPFFLTYVSNSLFVVLFPIDWGLKRVEAWKAGPAHRPERKLGAWDTIKISACICPLWFLAQGSYNWGLKGSSVASSTILSSTSSVWTLFFSACFLGERIATLKVVGVAACVGGAVLVAYSDTSGSDNQSDHLWGDGLCLFSAIMYGAYTTAIRKLVPEESINMSHFFGYLGAINALFLLPLTLVLHYANVESLKPLTWTIFGWVVLKGLTDNVLSDYLWARAIFLTSPTIATVGLSLTIPMSMLADWMFKSDPPTAMVVMGSVLVTAGFVSVNWTFGGSAGDDAADAHRSPTAVDHVTDPNPPKPLESVAPDAALSSKRQTRGYAS